MAIDLSSITPDKKATEQQDRQIKGSWNTKTTSNYSIGNLCYPENVTQSDDLKHAVVFYINIRSNSKYKTNTNTFVTDLSKTSPNKVAPTKDSLGEATSAVTIGTTLMGTAQGAMKGLSANAVTKRILAGGPTLAVAGAAKDIATGTVKGLGTGLAVKAGVALAGEMMGDESKMFRLKDAITLAVQQAPRTSYKMEYEDVDMGSIVGGTAGGANLANLATVEGLKALGSMSMAGSPKFSEGLQQMAGKSINPFKTTLFKGVGLRHFEFNYKFMSKSASEASNVKRIIDLFKFHMHPEFSDNKVFLTHPSEFQIVYYYNGQENENIHKISTCVLVDMDVDYGEEQMVTFVDGMPIEINMKLRFMETEIMTKERIQEGY